MPILTPCANAGAANNRPQATTAADKHLDFILVSPKFPLAVTTKKTPDPPHQDDIL
jgi:hypothetical protein